MKLSQLYQQSERPVITFECFPPRNEAAVEKFDNIADKLAALDPDAFSVTFGAGGSSREGSFQTLETLLERKKFPAVAYLAGFGLGLADIRSILDRYQHLGVETVFVVLGDEPTDEGFVAHPESFAHASEILAFIRQHYNFELGCAGYPEGHNQAESLEQDIDYLKLKTRNGAAYIVSQYCYDTDRFFSFVEKCRAAGITVPIVPGIMPVYTVKMTHNLARICGTTLPPAMLEKLDVLAEVDKEDVLQYGIDLAVVQCREFLKGGVPGLHFYTMNRSKSTTEILGRLKAERLL